MGERKYTVITFTSAESLEKFLNEHPESSEPYRILSSYDVLADTIVYTIIVTQSVHMPKL